MCGDLCSNSRPWPQRASATFTPALLPAPRLLRRMAARCSWCGGGSPTPGQTTRRCRCRPGRRQASLRTGWRPLRQRRRRRQRRARRRQRATSAPGTKPTTQPTGPPRALRPSRCGRRRQPPPPRRLPASAWPWRRRSWRSSACSSSSCGRGRRARPRRLQRMSLMPVCSRRRQVGGWARAGCGSRCCRRVLGIGCLPPPPVFGVLC